MRQHPPRLTLNQFLYPGKTVSSIWTLPQSWQVHGASGNRLKACPIGGLIKPPDISFSEMLSWSFMRCEGFSFYIHFICDRSTCCCRPNQDLIELRPKSSNWICLRSRNISHFSLGGMGMGRVGEELFWLKQESKLTLSTWVESPLHSLSSWVLQAKISFSFAKLELD